MEILTGLRIVLHFAVADEEAAEEEEGLYVPVDAFLSFNSNELS
jgi:hypothetical protein